MKNLFTKILSLSIIVFAFSCSNGNLNNQNFSSVLLSNENFTQFVQRVAENSPNEKNYVIEVTAKSVTEDCDFFQVKTIEISLEDTKNGKMPSLEISDIPNEAFIKFEAKVFTKSDYDKKDTKQVFPKVSASSEPTMITVDSENKIKIKFNKIEDEKPEPQPQEGEEIPIANVTIKFDGKIVLPENENGYKVNLFVGENRVYNENAIIETEKLNDFVVLNCPIGKDLPVRFWLENNNREKFYQTIQSKTITEETNEITIELITEVPEEIDENNGDLILEWLYDILVNERTIPIFEFSNEGDDISLKLGKYTIVSVKIGDIQINKSIFDNLSEYEQMLYEAELGDYTVEIGYKVDGDDKIHIDSKTYTIDQRL